MIPGQTSPQAQSVAIPKRLPLVIEPDNRAESVSFDARLVNCFMEKDENKETWIYERPGLDQLQRSPAADATGRGTYNWLGDIYEIWGNTLYKNAVAVSGTVDTTNGVYKFSQTLGATPKLQLGNGVKAYNYDAGSGLVEITDSDFPSPFVKGWAYLDGTTYVMDPDAFIQGSDINTPSDWDPLNVLQAQVESDMGVATAKQLVYVIAFKQWSTEVFYDAGNSSGSPLGPVQGAKIDYGCASEDSVQDVNGILCWLTSSREAGYQVAMLNRLKGDIVSTPAIDRLLQNADISTVYSWQLKVGKHRFYVLTIKEENLTLAFDLTDRSWCQWTDTNGNYFPIVSSTYSATAKGLLQHESNGRLYVADMTYATDDGDLIQVDIYTPNFDGGTRRRKQMNKLEVIADQQAGSILQVRTNDFDYNPKKWSNFRQFDLSQSQPFISECGTFVRRVHNFRHRKPVRMPRIQAMEMQIDIGTL